MAKVIDPHDGEAAIWPIAHFVEIILPTIMKDFHPDQPLVKADASESPLDFLLEERAKFIGIFPGESPGAANGTGAFSQADRVLIT